MTEHFGYAGNILRVDLSSGIVSSTPTAKYVDGLLGGRGIGTKIYWDEVTPEVSAFDPENRLIFVTGPATGIPPAGSRTQIYGKSPARIPEGFCYSNFGGSWGAQLKFAGFDGLIVQGKSERPVYLLIRDGNAEIRDASALWGKGTVEVREALKSELGRNVRVIATGPAGENGVVFANLLADEDSSSSSGFGAVMGDKKLKAIAVTGSGKIAVADKDKLRELTKYVRHLLGDELRIDPSLELPPDMKYHTCFACVGCRLRNMYEAKDGTKGKYMCASALFYQEFAKMHYGSWNEAAFFALRLCDQYGVDVWPIMSMIVWMLQCMGAGILTEEKTGLPLSKIGSLEFIETLVKKVALREGFGDVLAQGPVRAAASLGDESKAFMDNWLSDPLGHIVMFDPRVMSTTGLLYAMEPRQPIPQISEIAGRLVAHWVPWASGAPGAYISSDVLRGIGKKFWGSELAMDFSTHEFKASSAKITQDRIVGNECGIFCIYIYPMYHSPSTEDYVGDPSLESNIISAVTGQQIDEKGLHRIGERVFNLHRAVMAREGHRGRESDTIPEFCHTQPIQFEFANANLLVPGKDGEIISKKDNVLSRDDFDKMKDEFYTLRGWDVSTGLQTKEKLEELGLQEITADLEARGLVV
jgi:aldehyde:ferredoxin oxidoreductase